MDELQSNSEWVEAARWLKFEEDVENGGRWSKPHVATLSLHSLLELRNCLTTGAILLDFPGDDIQTIIESLLENVVRLKYLDENKKDLVKNALLLKHVHQHEKEFQKQLNNGDKRQFPLIKSLADMSKKSSNVDMQAMPNLNTNMAKNQSTNLLSATENTSRAIFDISGSQFIKKTDSKPKDLLTQIGSSVSVASNISRQDYKINQNFMRKIPIGAEASNVLVGEVDFLDHQFTSFVRLSKAVILGDFTEVPVPTRFLFIILGPKGNISKYHEIGRSISTLMSDEIFHDIAYRAKNRQEILFAFDGFLDQVTVLPPGEWDPSIRLKPPNKIPLKEERLEKIQADINKLNGSVNTSLKKFDDEINPHETDPGLEFTGRFCGGLIDDIKRKAPWFLSDFTDGLNFQCLSSILFMYFACLSPIITFGGLLGAATDQNMSAIESLVSGIVCGVLFGLFSGQPLTILGSTGPVLVFESILNIFSKENGIDYMGFRAWVGLWTALILIIIVLSDCSALVKYITRFTEESFASLIALIFIIESVDKLIDIKKLKRYSNDPFDYVNDYTNNTDCLRCVYLGSMNNTFLLNSSIAKTLNKIQCEKLGPDYKYLKECKYSPDVFFFSALLYIFTFCLAMAIRFFKTSRFFPSTIRTKVADFGVVITIASAVFVDWYFSFDTPKLIVPLKFQTTIPTRGWFINPITRNPGKLWLCLLAILPALLATILIFMDQHISCVIVNRKENKLKKGGGYHLDLLIVAITIAINSLLGIPWFVAATVLSINHVLSLKKESEAAAPGEKPKFLGVIEQRLTNTVVFIMIGCSVFLANFLRMIPMPVLYGVFLYMGISSLNGIQFMNRILIIFMPEKHQPDYIFLRHVRTFKVHMFTFIQVSSILLLFIIKSNKKISISFPLMMPEIVKRSKEDGIANADEVPPIKDRIIVKDDSINISNELSRTNIWQDMVNNDKQLINKKESMRNRKIQSNLNPVEDLPLVEEKQVPKFVLNEGVEIDMN